MTPWKTTTPRQSIISNARPVDAPFWQTQYLTTGWNCQCGEIQLTRWSEPFFNGTNGRNSSW